VRDETEPEQEADEQVGDAGEQPERPDQRMRGEQRDTEDGLQRVPHTPEEHHHADPTLVGRDLVDERRSVRHPFDDEARSGKDAARDRDESTEHGLVLP
jgi:hypothetical protein